MRREVLFATLTVLIASLTSLSNCEEHQLFANNRVNYLNGERKPFGRPEVWYNKRSLVFMASIWAFLFLFISVIYIFCPEGHRRIDEINDGCQSSTAYYKYMISFKFGHHSTRYPTKTAYVMIDFMDDRKLFITRIAIPPLWMSSRRCTRLKSAAFDHVKLAKFHLNRNAPMPDVAFVRVAHDCYKPYGEFVLVVSIELKDLMANTITHIPVLTEIRSLGPDRSPNEQVFAAKPPVIVKQDEDDLFQEGITPFISFSEWGLFFVLYVNVNSFVCILVPYPMDMFDKTRVVINAFASSYCSLFVTLIVALIFRKGVKLNFAIHRGTGAWKMIRLLFLFLVVLTSLAFGGTGALLMTTFVSQEPIVHWFIAIVISVITLVFVYIPLIILIGHKCGYTSYAKTKHTDESRATLVPGKHEISRTSLKQSTSTIEREESAIPTSVSQYSIVQGSSSTSELSEPKDKRKKLKTATKNVQKSALDVKSSKSHLSQAKNSVRNPNGSTTKMSKSSASVPIKSRQSLTTRKTNSNQKTSQQMATKKTIEKMNSKHKV